MRKTRIRFGIPSKKVAARVLGVAAIGVFATVGLSGCGYTQIDPSGVGLYYKSGSWDGKVFDKVVEPGATDWKVNDFIVQLPTGQRSLIVRNSDDSDVKGYISVPSKDNLLIDYEISVAFKLNTLTDDMDGGTNPDGTTRPDYKGGTLRKFYEDICRQDDCDLDDDGKTSDGWMKMLKTRMLPQVETALKDEARKYEGDPIVGNTTMKVQVDGKDTEVGTLTHLQQTVAVTFQDYLERQLGAKYFCGPNFDRVKQQTCNPIQLSIISADYNNPEVRKSREAKKVANDQSVAQSQLEKALQDPNYLEYLRIQAMMECTKQAKAICIFNAAPGTSVSVNPPK
jgi:hypothetical protein